MFLQSMRMDRFGGCHDVQLDGFSDSIQVIYGPAGAGKRTILQFLRAMLLGFDRTTRERYLPAHSRGFGGAITLGTDQGMQTVSRYDDGSIDGRLTVEHGDGRVIGHRHLETLLSGVTTEQFDHLFAVDFSTRPHVDCLVANLEAAGILLSEGRESSELSEMQRKLDQYQHEFQSLPTSSYTVESLHRRRKEITEEVTALEARLASAQYDEDRQRLLEQRQSIDRQLSEARARLKDLEATLYRLRARRDELRRGTAIRAETSQHTPVPDEVDRQIERWRKLAIEVADRKRKLQAEKEHHDIGVERTANPRRSLSALEKKIQHLETRLSAFGGVGEQPLWHELRTELQLALTEMRRELYALCGELGHWESASELTSQASELQQLTRCEEEFQRAIEILQAKRPAHRGDVSHRHEKWCRCAAHPTEQPAEIVHAESGSTAQLDAEIARIEKEHVQLRERINTWDSQLVDLNRRLAQVRAEDGHHLRQQLEARRAERGRVERDIRYAEQRQILAETIAELQLKMRAFDGPVALSSVVSVASRYLCELSGGALRQLEFDSQNRVAVFDQASRRFTWQQLDESGRDHTYLSILLASQASLAANGYHVPLVLREAFSNLDSRDVPAAVEILQEVAGHRQVLVLTRHRHVADEFKNLLLPVQSISEWSVTESYNDLPVRYDHVESVSRPHWNLDRLATHDEYCLSDESPVEDAPSVASADAAHFRRIGVRTVGQLLDLSPEETAIEMRSVGITVEQVQSWQAQARLMCRVPHLRAYDARILVACDVTDPEQLRSISPHRLREIVQRFASSRNGQSLLLSGTEFELSRVEDWIRTDGNGSDLEDDSLIDYSYRRSGVRRQRSASNDRSSGRTRGGERRVARSLRSRPEPVDPEAELEQDSTTQSKRRVVKMPESDQLHFYLNSSDPVVDAPSIGPRTAQRLKAIGIHSVHDLLQADHHELADRLGQKRINEDTVLRWQQQTTLAIRIPQLRGHDAQILVALGITTPEQLAEMDPNKLWSDVEPFVLTNQGKRIIRNGRRPDLQEVADWITWASSARSLQAA